MNLLCSQGNHLSEKDEKERERESDGKRKKVDLLNKVKNVFWKSFKKIPFIL